MIHWNFGLQAVERRSDHLRFSDVAPVRLLGSIYQPQSDLAMADIPSIPQSHDPGPGARASQGCCNFVSQELLGLLPPLL